MKFKRAEQLWEQLLLYKDEVFVENSAELLERVKMLSGALDGDSEMLFALEAGCIIAAAFKDKVPAVFFYPIRIMISGSEEIALALIADFCRVNELREVITDVPQDRLPVALRGVLHARLDAQDERLYTLAVETECMLLSDFPELMADELYLGEPTENFADDYKRIIFDKDVNRYTGYDVRRDSPETDPLYLIEEARADFYRGNAVTVFATLLSDEGDNVFIGEGVLYRFDGRGGAEISVRLLPEWQGKGYGKKLTLAMIELARSIDLRRLFAIVNQENTRSKSLFASLMKTEYENEHEIAYSYEIKYEE